MNTTSNVSKHVAEGGRLVHRGRESGEEVAPSSASRQSSLEPRKVPVRIILADSEAIFRVGMARIFSVESDLDVVAQTDNLPQTISVVAETQADVILFEAGLSPTPAEAVSEVARRALPGAKLILVTQRAGEQETVDYLRRGVRGILTRAVSPDLLVRCVRKVAAGETWLDKQGVNWVIEAYRSQALQGAAPKQQLRLSEKEMLIISGVTQGLKNKDIAREVGTTEQVVKNYLRKIYDKLQVSDRLELALYSMHHRLLDGYVPRLGREARHGVEDSGKAAEIPRAGITSASAGNQTPSHQPQQPKHDSNSNDC
jgi:two-component system, NarL family, nitrate/nitrite response regulator NarL